MLVVEIENLRKGQSAKTSLTKNSYLLEQCGNKNHQHVGENNFQVFANNYLSVFKKKFGQAAFIKEGKLTLNIKEEAGHLQLYN